MVSEELLSAVIRAPLGFVRGGRTGRGQGGFVNPGKGDARLQVRGETRSQSLFFYCFISLKHGLCGDKSVKSEDLMADWTDLVSRCLTS